MARNQVLAIETSQRPWNVEFKPQGATIRTAYSRSGNGRAIGCMVKDEQISSEQFNSDVNHLIGCVNAIGAIEHPELALRAVTNAIRDAAEILKGVCPQTQYHLRVLQNLLNTYEILRKR